MPQLIHPHQVKIITSEGEVQVHITLDLNINLATGDVLGVKQHPKQEQEEEEKTEMIVPTFSSANKIKFGKKE